MNLKDKFRHVIDFPKEGVDFIDITTILQNPKYFKEAIDQIAEVAKKYDFDVVIGPESRGFIFGCPVAYNMNKGFVPIRKKGKLPYKTIQAEYGLEYGTAILEVHIDAIKPEQRVLVIDDLLATGGTMLTNLSLIEELGGVVSACIFLIELTYLNGRERLKGYNIESIVKFDE